MYRRPQTKNLVLDSKMSMAAFCRNASIEASYIYLASDRIQLVDMQDPTRLRSCKSTCYILLKRPSCKNLLDPTTCQVLLRLLARIDSWDILCIYIPEDPAFSTGGRPIFKFKQLCIGSTYSINQNIFKDFNFISY